MTSISTQKIALFRSKLSDYPEAMEALEVIEDCEGNLEDATLSLAIQVGQQPDIDNEQWLNTLAKKCRAVICKPNLRQDLENKSYANVIKELAKTPLIPEILATPVIIYVIEEGLDCFCQPLEGKFSNS